jgi:hypothetical protein
MIPNLGINLLDTPKYKKLREDMNIDKITLWKLILKGIKLVNWDPIIFLGHGGYFL